MERQNFQAALLKLYKNQKDCDIFFKFPNNNIFFEKPTIGAHKRILALASSVFDTMFYGPTTEPSANDVIVFDITIWDFKFFLSFIYGSEIKFESIQDAGVFYYAADKYNCKDAIQCVSDYLQKEVYWDNSIEIYEIALEFKNYQLKALSIKEFSSNGLILFCEDFLAAKPETLEEIFKQPTLRVDSEIKLIKALEQYVQYNKRRDPEILVKIRPALCQIRFLTLTFKDIIRTTLLTHEEIVGILEGLEPEPNLSKMPEGFSTIKAERVCNNPETKRKLTALERIYSNNICVNCSYQHYIWNCEFVLMEHRQALHEVYKKYSHVCVWIYSDEDLKALFDIFKSAGYHL